MNFESIHPSRPSKKLQIRLIIEEGISPDSIFFGQYIDFESDPGAINQGDYLIFMIIPVILTPYSGSY